MAKFVPAAVAGRAHDQFVPDLATGCHISTYSVGSHGYAQVGWTDKASGRTTGTTAHRASWVAEHGQIPDGMTIDHNHDLCGSRRCVNVAHLRMMTNIENARRTFGRNWPEGGGCIMGHDPEWFTLTGTKRPRHRCVLCNRAAQARYRERKRAGLI